MNRRVHAEVPPKVEYSLTSLGEDLNGVITQMAAWAEKYRALGSQAAAHLDPGDDRKETDPA